MERIAVSKFKARCLALLDTVNASGRTLLITKRGRPLARIVPTQVGTGESRSPIGCMSGTAREVTEIIGPVDVPWSALADVPDEDRAAT